MDRLELFALASALGWMSGAPLTLNQRRLITEKLMQADLGSHLQYSKEQAVDALLEELS